VELAEARRRFVLTLDLKDDEAAHEQYRRYHTAVWPEVLDALRAAGVTGMEIYQLGSRLCMVMEVNAEFNFARKAEIDAQSQAVQDWERLMWRFQRPLPTAGPGEKWVVMKRIFSWE
jgi:L-rhamnose mutarotase